MTAASLNNVRVLVFGDQTDTFYPTIKLLYSQASSSPWLRRFLQSATAVVKEEINALEPRLRDSFGGDFTDLVHLAGRFQGSNDTDGLPSTVLVNVMRAGVLIQYAESNPEILSPKESVCVAAACGGLLNAVALMYARDMASLCQAGLDTIRMARRLSQIVLWRARSLHNGPGCWGWLVSGIKAGDLQAMLDSYHAVESTPNHRTIKVAGSGVADAWHTVIGPPAVLEDFFGQYPPCQRLTKSRLQVTGPVHVIPDVQLAEVEHIAAGMTCVHGMLDSSPRTDIQLVSLGEGGLLSAPTWKELLELVVREILSQPLNMTRGLTAVESAIPHDAMVNVFGAGPSPHIPTLCVYLKGKGRKVISVATEPESPSAPLPGQGSGRIAIVGMGGRYPRSGDLEEFWDKICQGKALHSEIPEERFSLDDYYSSSNTPHTTNTKYGCFLDSPGQFDARFFNLSPREAMEVDPSHRLFLLAVYEALEVAGYFRRPHTKTESCRFATIVGQISDDWTEIIRLRGGDAFSLTGNQRSFAAGRVNYHFKWAGPAVTLDTACSSSMTALTQACTLLLTGDCDMAVAGGTNIFSSPFNFNILGKAGFTSTTGGCKSYRADADGYCRGEFVGAFVLKRYEDALKDNDNILATVLGSARNHSGNAISITHSDHEAQEHLMAEVLRKAHLEASDVSYVEMHGTGTQVGDYAEMKAVSNALGRNRRKDRLRVGSIKANAGHGEAGAGAAAVIKAIMMFEKNIIPPQAGLPAKLNPRFPPLSELNIDIPASVTEFKSAPERPRRILINNFDASGGNTCLLLEEPPAREPVASIPLPSRHVVVTSAKSAKSHESNKRNLLAYIKQNPTVQIQDLAYTTTARRIHHPIRSAYATTSVAELERQIEMDLASTPTSPQTNSSATRSPVLFMFSGQGQLYAGMGADLYRDSPAFRDEMDKCIRICASFGFPSFDDILKDPAAILAGRPTSETQLATVCLEISLAAFWASCGIVPAVVMGHSLGEFAALHVAGVLTLADTLLLVGKRALVMEARCQAGIFSMLQLAAPLPVVKELLRNHPGISISCINGPAAIVVSGPAEDVTFLQTSCRTQQIRFTLLKLPYAFHSHQMDPALDEYEAVARTVHFDAPKTPFASTLLGHLVSEAGQVDAKYMVRQTREPVDFVGAIKAVETKLKDCLWLELGPSSVLVDLVKPILQPSGQARTACSLKSGTSAWTSISAALAAAYEAQQEIDWAGFHAPYISGLRLLRLPFYAFDLKNYWRSYPARVDPVPTLVAPSQSHGLPPPPLSTCLHYAVSESGSTSTFRSHLAEPDLKALIDGHRLMDVSISPACVLGEMAMAATTHMLKKVGREVKAIQLGARDCVFFSPVSIDASRADQSVVITAELDRAGDVVDVKMLADTGAVAAQVKIQVVNPMQHKQQWASFSPFIWQCCSAVVEAAKSGRGQRLTPAFFYSIFAQTVSYSPAFQRIVDVYLSPDMTEGVAEVVLGPTPDSCTFTLNPYWVDSLTHLAGFLVNGDPAKPPGTMFMMNTYDSFNIVEPLEPGVAYTVYTRIVRKEKKSSVVNVYVFREERLVMQNLGLHLQQIPTSLITSMIGKTTQAGALAAKQGLPLARAAPARTPMREHPAAPALIETQAQRQQGPSQKAQQESSSIADLLMSTIAEETGCEISDLTPNTILPDLGVDSIMAIQIAEKLQAKLGCEIGAALFHEHPSISELQAALGSRSATSNVAQNQETALPAKSVPASPRLQTQPSPEFHNHDLSEVLLSTIARETGAEQSELEVPHTSLADLGVDSIMAMQIASSFLEQTGVDLHPSALVENPTMGDLRRLFQQLQQQQHPEPGSSSSSGFVTVEHDQSPVEEPVLVSASDPGPELVVDSAPVDALHALLAPAAPKDAWKPKVNAVLMHGRKTSGLAPLFMFPDGAGGASTYMYLKRFRNDRPMYVLESPYLHNPEAFTVGVETVAALFKQAVLDIYPAGGFLLSGYSGGAVYAYETARQLMADGHVVQGLLLFDMAVPQLRPDPGMPPAMTLLLPQQMVKAREWADPAVMRGQLAHMAQMVRTVSEYDAVPMPADRRPRRTWITWCKRGVVERLDDLVINQLRKKSILVDSIPNFMEDPAVGPFAWAIPKGKPLGPNGWDRLVGNVRCSSIDADHFTMVIPPDVAKFQKALEDALVYCTED
ncbi:hypothetical protein PgNI_05168 [Pyricularia grisea]|uniref:Polyketide synthase n=1 Tax=Pyricularia grisea TaxID=148305 RepID=A0A6P8B701_PYRGI|nr:hypothetical protein PgNI_05168 [Pyricularia grisea]TLD11092.1 hypothetical protein PgNI_05168 [Pyricularia grisea]